MSDLLKSISLAALVACAGPALAQDASGSGADSGSETTGQSEDGSQDGTGTEQSGTGSDAEESGTGESGTEGEPGMVEPSGADDLSMGEPAEGVEEPDGAGTSYVAETFGDWEQRCVRAETGADPCQLYQLLRDESDNAVAEMSIFPLPEGREAAAGSTIITPLETLLTRSVRLTVDDGETRRYPFEFCTRQGCISRVGFTNGEINQFKRGAAGTLIIVPAAAPDQEISLTISLTGFTDGFEAVTEANRDAADAVQE